MRSILEHIPPPSIWTAAPQAGHSVGHEGSAILAAPMAHDDDPDSALAALEAEQRELLGEVDGLRGFIACMDRLVLAMVGEAARCLEE